MTPLRTGAVVLDIEGTTGSLTHVRDVLFPFARERLPAFFARNAGSPRLTEIVEAVRRVAARPGLDEAAVLDVLSAWADQDAKAAPLKTVQGWIWAEGYARGELHGHVYPDVPEALRRWRADGAQVFSYSSGSVSAQRDWYRHTAHGDLTPLFRQMFDLVSVGPKDCPASYRTLRTLLGRPSAPPVFLSDVAAELDAAATAGWSTVGVRRDGDPRGPEVPGHPTVPSLDRVLVRGGTPPDGAREAPVGHGTRRTPTALSQDGVRTGREDPQ
ncbi:acireductone synthase [Streptomyces sp. NPDC047108]|uniref:acireductone synthase n=1 Tax=Streptomyces sp. NPDC047108 TaxID=3155025 RepID=UPI003406BFF9